MTKKGIAIVVLTVLLVGVGIFLYVKKGKSSEQAATSKNELPSSNDVSQVPESVEQATGTPAITPSIAVKEVTEITLSITSPQADSTTSSNKTTVKGKTSPKAEVFANEAEGIADANGNFSLTVMLDEGENSIIITAVDADGKVAEKEIFVTYEAGE
jgi:bacillopeptidase F